MAPASGCRNPQVRFCTASAKVNCDTEIPMSCVSGCMKIPKLCRSPMLRVSISEAPQVSQPAPLSRGQTVVVPRSKVGVQEDGKRLAVVREGVSLQQLVDGLNALGIGPRDLIAILQAIKAAGAIQADIEVM